MKHIHESIIGRRGNYNIPDKDNAFAKAIYRNPKNIFMVYPVNNEDYYEISNTIMDVKNVNIEEVYLSGGEVIFVGIGEDFKKVHINQEVDCYIYSIFPHKIGDVITWLDYHIEYMSDVLKYSDIIDNVYDGKIKF